MHSGFPQSLPWIKRRPVQNEDILKGRIQKACVAKIIDGFLEYVLDRLICMVPLLLGLAGRSDKGDLVLSFTI